MSPSPALIRVLSVQSCHRHLQVHVQPSHNKKIRMETTVTQWWIVKPRELSFLNHEDRHPAAPHSNLHRDKKMGLKLKVSNSWNQRTALSYMRPCIPSRGEGSSVHSQIELWILSRSNYNGFLSISSYLNVLSHVCVSFSVLLALIYVIFITYIRASNFFLRLCRDILNFFCEF